MAAAAHNTNVVRLPTAARRQVKQPQNAAGRAARMALREACPFPGEYIFPGQRAAMPIAEALIEVQQTLTPEMELLAAICATLDDTARTRVLEMLASGVALGRRTAVRAFAVVRSQRMTAGEYSDLKNAMRRIRGS